MEPPFAVIDPATPPFMGAPAVIENAPSVAVLLYRNHPARHAVEAVQPIRLWPASGRVHVGEPIALPVELGITSYAACFDPPWLYGIHPQPAAASRYGLSRLQVEARGGQWQWCRALLARERRWSPTRYWLESDGRWIHASFDQYPLTISRGQLPDRRGQVVRGVESEAGYGPWSGPSPLRPDELFLVLAQRRGDRGVRVVSVPLDRSREEPQTWLTGARAVGLGRATYGPLEALGAVDISRLATTRTQLWLRLDLDRDEGEGGYEIATLSLRETPAAPNDRPLVPLELLGRPLDFTVAADRASVVVLSSDAPASPFARPPRSRWLQSFRDTGEPLHAPIPVLERADGFIA